MNDSRDPDDGQTIGRRDIGAVLLGVAGGTLLSGCANKWEAPREEIGEAKQALGSEWIVFAEDVGIEVTGINTGAQNTAALAAWLADGGEAYKTLQFGPGTYLFDPGSEIPYFRKLRGVQGPPSSATTTGTILKADDTGDFLFSLDSSGGYIEDLVIDGDELVDAGIKSHGTCTPTAGPTIFAKRISIRDCLEAGIDAYQVAVELDEVSVYLCPVGILMVSCSESRLRSITTVLCSDAGLRVTGSYSGESCVSNSGILHVWGFKGSNGDYGMDLWGVGASGIYGYNFEGANEVNVRMRDCTGVKIYGLRAVGGTDDLVAVFDACNDCEIFGSCQSTEMVVHHTNGSRACLARIYAESGNFPDTIDQIWITGGTEWVGWYTHTCLQSVQNNAPTAGYWELGTVVFARAQVTGAPVGWVCTANGSPGTWVPFGYVPGTVQTYSATNVSTDRTYNANATTVDELADVLGTLIADLRAHGLVD